MKYLTIVTLTFNNPEELSFTLSSFTYFSKYIEFLIIDSSEPKIFAQNRAFIESIIPTNSFKHISVKPSGIYPAMNRAILLSTGMYINFMNSGDRVFSNHVYPSICELISQLALSTQDRLPSLIYGRTMIQSTRNTSIKYINPPLNVNPSRRIYWNKIIPPGHQSCFFNRLWHLQNLYDLSDGLAADRRIILRSLNSSYFINDTISLFHLSGVTSLNNIPYKKALHSFSTIGSLTGRIGFFPKLILRFCFRDNWEVFRMIRLHLLSFFIF